jgi:hypothetical protein
LSERVEGLWGLAEEIDVEDGFGIWQVKATEVGV